MTKSLLNHARWDVTIGNRSVTGNTVTYANTSAVAGVATTFAGAEHLAAGQTVGTVNYTVLFRTDVAIDADDVVWWNGVTLHVQSVRMVTPLWKSAFCVERQ